MNAAGGHAAESEVGPAVVVVVLEACEWGLEFRAASEEPAGQEFVAEFAEKALDPSALLGLCRLDESARLKEGREQYLAIGDDVSGHFSNIDIDVSGFKRHHRLASVCLASDGTVKPGTGGKRPWRLPPVSFRAPSNCSTRP